MLSILSTILGTAMNKQNSENGRISYNQYTNNAKALSQLIRG